MYSWENFFPYPMQTLGIQGLARGKTPGMEWVKRSISVIFSGFVCSNQSWECQEMKNPESGVQGLQTTPNRVREWSPLRLKVIFSLKSKNSPFSGTLSCYSIVPQAVGFSKQQVRLRLSELHMYTEANTKQEKNAHTITLSSSKYLPNCALA